MYDEEKNMKKIWMKTQETEMFSESDSLTCCFPHEKNYEKPPKTMRNDPFVMFLKMRML